MLRENKKFFIVTCIITLLPMLVGLLLWNQLPDRVATHFGTDGTPNGYSSKLVAVTGIYLFCLAVHVICAFVTTVDPKGKNISQKVYRLVLCICPLVSLYAGFCVYGNALGYKEINNAIWINAMLAVILIVVGNYLPKCRQNYTIGIKLPWTLADEDNWNYTHRLAGKWWILGGVLTFLAGFQSWVDPLYAGIVITMLAVLIPAVASYLYFRKHRL